MTDTLQIFRVKKEWADGVQSFGHWYDNYEFTVKEKDIEEEKHHVVLGYTPETIVFSIESSYVTLVPKDYKV